MPALRTGGMRQNACVTGQVELSISSHERARLNSNYRVYQLLPLRPVDE